MFGVLFAFNLQLELSYGHWHAPSLFWVGAWDPLGDGVGMVTHTGEPLIHLGTAHLRHGSYFGYVLIFGCRPMDSGLGVWIQALDPSPPSGPVHLQPS